MEKEIEVINYIYQNVSMGIEGIDDCLKYVDNDDFASLLRHQKIEYINLKKEAQLLMDNFEEQCKDINIFVKASSYVMTKMNLMENNSVSHIAKMMLQGTNMGITAIKEKLNNYKDIDKKIYKLAKKLEKNLTNNMEELQKFL